MRISLASPEDIRERSYGEVLNAETLNYKTLKAERGGLFDEQIFGPTKDYECACAKYKKKSYANRVCEECGVEITESIVRRERMGHIELACPVTHIWMLKTSPSRIAVLLNMKGKELDDVNYFVSYVVLDPGSATDHLSYKLVLDLGSGKEGDKTRLRLRNTLKDIDEQLEADSFAHEYCQYFLNQLSNFNNPVNIVECLNFISKYTNAKFGIGAEAIYEMLANLDLAAEITAVKAKLAEKKNITNQKILPRRLQFLTNFLESKNRPEWMILKVLPVLPPDLRPIIQLDGGRITSSDLNDLYRQIIIRNNRLKRALAPNNQAFAPPTAILNNDKRIVQDAVDALLDNEKKARPTLTKSKRAYKSLSSNLKGKKGRFRQNLLGKRVDYSGRSVIVVGPTLKLYQCGLPRYIAMTLFKPFVISLLVKHKEAHNTKTAEKMIDDNYDLVWDYLNEAIKERPVLLNRAPTLHRLGIQAFEPILVKGNAIHLHPLVTTAFNADFDGDQMAVHLPISAEAVAEARSLMLGSKSILGPKDGQPIVTPTQDMVLGNYYLTIEKRHEPGEGKIFASYYEVLQALSAKVISLHSLIAIPASVFEDKLFEPNQNTQLLITTAGKIIFNNIFCEHLPFLNSAEQAEAFLTLPDRDLVPFGTNIRQYLDKHWSIHKPFKKATLGKIIDYHFTIFSFIPTAQVLDKMKDLGFKYSKESGVTISAGDIDAYEKKEVLFAAADEKIQALNEFYAAGLINATEKKQKICDLWIDVKAKIEDDISKQLAQEQTNSIYMMIDSGARGNKANLTQLIGMRGLMNNPKGEVIDIPIKSSFREGLKVSEFFISTHGARKGMADVALKTSDSGYLTRRLVDVSQDVIITSQDCHSAKGYVIKDIIDTKTGFPVKVLGERLLGRVLFADLQIKDRPMPIKANTLLDQELVAEIVADPSIKTVEIRSVLTCNQAFGVCRLCFGTNLATGKLVKMNEAVGVIAAQSIGEPGTQLTMRTFHTGGVAGGTDITQGLPRIKELFDVTTPKGTIAVISEIAGEVTNIVLENGIYHISVTNEQDSITYVSLYNASLRVKVGDKVTYGQKLTDGAININKLLLVSNITKVQNYILKEVQKVYSLQGIVIADKYIEIILRQMLRKVLIIDSGESKLLVMDVVDIFYFKAEVRRCFEANLKPPIAKHVILGVKKAPLQSESFLSSASFQETTRVLVKAATKSSIDQIRGLKENIMIGNLIPAGTGLMKREAILAAGRKARAEEY